MIAVERIHLSNRHLVVRAFGLLTVVLGVAGLRLVNPEMLSWLPFRTSCGAASGLPCIFCGTTRALHYLLNGELAQALYFNWLALPLASLALLFAAGTAAELILRRRLRLRLPSFRFTPRVAALSSAALLAIWVFQVSLAVSLHKRELLNPNGVLYAIVTR